MTTTLAASSVAISTAAGVQNAVALGIEASANSTERLLQSYTYVRVCYYTYEGIDLIGGDVGSVSGVSAGFATSTCQVECVKKGNCQSYTWTNYNGGTCWLKSGDMAAKVTSGAISAFVRPKGTADCPKIRIVMNGYDFPGGDIGNARGGDVYACYQQCINVAGCNAYTWSDYNGGTCWFKNSGEKIPTSAPGKSAGVAFQTGSTLLMYIP